LCVCRYVVVCIGGDGMQYCVYGMPPSASAKLLDTYKDEATRKGIRVHPIYTYIYVHIYVYT